VYDQDFSCMEFSLQVQLWDLVVSNSKVGRGQGHDVQGQGLGLQGQGLGLQGQGLGPQGQGPGPQGQGHDQLSSRRLEAKAMASRTPSLETIRLREQVLV